VDADLANIAGGLASLASVAVVTAIPIVVPALLKRMGIANNAALTAQLDVLCESGAGAAYKYAASSATGLSDVNVHNAALAAGLNYINARAPDLAKQCGLTPDHVAQQVSAELGKLLATDPTVTAGVPVATSTAVPVVTDSKQPAVLPVAGPGLVATPVDAAIIPADKTG
jgi:hypothetical protein